MFSHCHLSAMRHALHQPIAQRRELSLTQPSLYRVLSRVPDAGGNRDVVESVLLQERAQLAFGHRMGRVFDRREPSLHGDLDEEFCRCSSYGPTCYPIFCHSYAFLGLSCISTPRGMALLLPRLCRCYIPPALHTLHEPIAQHPQASIGHALAHGELGPDLGRRESLRTRETPATRAASVMVSVAMDAPRERAKRTRCPSSSASDA